MASMARVPWAIIKLCLPCWLLESAPYKQAFTLSLIILIPPLLVSPFLFSPLLILLLLSFATVVGALSAWISMKASRMVLKHTIPLHLPTSLNSCLKLFAKAVLVHIVGSFPVINKLPWAWFSFAGTLIEVKGSNQDGRITESTVSSVSGYDVVSSIKGETEGIKLSSLQSQNVGETAAVKAAGGTVGSEYASKIKKVESIGFGFKETVAASDDGVYRVENLEKKTFLDFNPDQDESQAVTGINVQSRRCVVHSFGGFNGHQSSNVDSSSSLNGNGKGNSVAGILGRREGSQDERGADIPGILSVASKNYFKGDYLSRNLSGMGMQTCKRKSVSEGDNLEYSIEESMSDDHSCFVGPRENIGETKYTGGCNSHSWCQKGVNLEAELSLLVEDIHFECLENWYPSLSGNEEFPLEFKVLLDMCIKRVASLGESTNISSLSIKLGSLFLCHLREFRKSRRKKRAAEAIMHEANQAGADDTILAEPSENCMAGDENASGGDGSLKCSPEASFVATSDCKINTMAVEKDNSKSPREVSPRLPSTSSRDSPAPGSSLARTSPEVLIGEEAYYRLRFGSSTRKKNVHAHYLVNLSTLVVKDFVCAVGKLPIDPEVKQYFKDFGSSLAESPAGKVLVSMISRKVFLPLVDAISDPKWLNARVAYLLIDHVGAKVSLDSLREEEENISYFSVSASSEVSKKGDHGFESLGDHSSGGAISVEKCVEVCAKNEENSSRDERRKSLSLPLEVSSSITNPIDGRISSVLGGIISATAGPLLPDNVGISYKPIKRMWNSPSVEEGKEIDGEPEYKKKVRQFGRHIVDGLPVYSSALSGRAAVSSTQGGMLNDPGMLSASVAKTMHESIQKKSTSSPAVKKPTKKKFLGLPLTSKQSAEVNPYGGLIRSKSSHDVQASNEGNWHVEEGSELHEGAYLSDDAGSPIDGSKEDRDCFSRKSARCRSFHGMNYSRQREALRARFAQKQDNLKRGFEQKGMATGANQVGGGITHESKPVSSGSRASSEEPFSEENDKVFDDDVVKFGKGLSTCWVKHSSGSSAIPSDLEADLSLVEAAGSSSSRVTFDKAGRVRFGSRGKSLSDGDEVPDTSKRDRSPRVKRDDAGIVGNEMADPISSAELDSGKRSEEFLQSSPLPGVENDTMNEIVKDISPVYEEVEDLPSTVAKLKAFLKERNGSQKSEESAPSSAEGGKRDFDSLSSLELSLEQDSVPLPKPPSSPLEERPFSCPSDGGIFLNVRIPYTEICKASNSSQSSNPLLQNNPLVFYCIEYDAAYPEEGADAAVVGLTGGDAESQVSSGINSVLPGEDNRKIVENSESSETVLPSPGTVISHIVVKRQFQEFLDLHAQLESDPLWRDALKGLKGPTRWLNLPFGKASASTVAGRRTLLQAYLRGVCTSMPQLASRSKALRTFMAYQGTSKILTSGEALPFSVERVLPITAEGGEGGVPRIDKFFARTVSGMFNTLKTALPGFDSQESSQQASDTHTSALSTPLPQSMVPSHLDPSSAPAALGEAKTSFGHPGTIKGTMMQLPAFLQFGSSNVAAYPDLVDWDMDYSERDSIGFNSSSSIEGGIPVKTYSLEDDVRVFLERLGKSPTTKEGAEFAFEALDPINDFEDSKDVDDQSLLKRSGSQYLVDSADEDGEEEELDAFLPLCKLAINILCESLRGTGSWVSQGTVVHASKVIFGSSIEEKLKDFLKSVTSKEMWRHYVHTLRVVLFHPPPVSLNQPGLKENRSISEQQLAAAIFTAFPLSLRQVIGHHELLEAAKFIAESLQNKVILRELVLQVLHICVTHLISSGGNAEEK